MTKRIPKLDLNKLKTYPLKERENKVKVKDFAKPLSPNCLIADLYNSLPKILAGNDLREVVQATVNAKERNKPIIWGLGGHVIKCGLSPILIDLMKRGLVTAIALNGGASIHDFEIALIGQTSENVASELPKGRFGMAKETAKLMNEAIKEGAKNNWGMGEALGKKLHTLLPSFRKYSLLFNALEYKVPVTVHVAVGTDIIHMHPEADGEAIGKTSLIDFRTFTSLVTTLNRGGVYLNFGSAVILPEVFLKAVAIVNNIGNTLKDFTTVNFDMIQHYRPSQNVVKRPTAQGGQGYSITGSHEILIPLFAAGLLTQLYK